MRKHCKETSSVGVVLIDWEGLGGSGEQDWEKKIGAK